MFVSPDSGTDRSGEYSWQLFDLTRDFSQSRDVSTRHPEKLKEMQALFDDEARRNAVYPLDDRTSFARMAPLAEHYAPSRLRYDYWGKDISLARDVWPSFGARGFTLDADVKLAPGQTGGVIAAVGSWFAGWSFHLKDGRSSASRRS